MDDPSTTHFSVGNNDVRLGDLLAASNIEQARQASAPLLSTSAAARYAKDPRLTDVFQAWWRRAADPVEPERIETLALLWRLTSLSAMSGHRRRLAEWISEGFDLTIPQLSTLTDPKDRRAVAEAFSLAPLSPELANYAADGIVNDPDPKSDARDAMCAVLLRQTGNVGSLFALLAEHIAASGFSQQDPAAGRARRVAWILRSLRRPLYEDEEAEAAEDFGQYFEQFVSRGLGGAHTANRAALVDGAREIVLTLNTIVRLHGLRLATHAETYRAIETLRRRFETTDWPKELHDPVNRLSARVLEALLVLARQGIADAGLRRVYVALLGRVVSGTRLRAIAAENDGLENEIAYWLETGQSRERIETASAIEETATAMVDLELGRALREAYLADRALERGENPDRLIGRMARELREAARKRGIVLRGEPGETVDFSPVEHESDPSVMGHRRVTLVTPAVERIAAGRSIAILVKAEVKASDRGED